MVSKNQFFAFMLLSIIFNTVLLAPFDDWNIIKPDEIVPKHTTAYDILMRQQEQAKDNFAGKFKSWITNKSIHNDPKSGFTTFSRPEKSFIPTKQFDESWDEIENPQPSQKERKLSHQALQSIQNITQHYQNIADGTIQPDPSDEKILNDFFAQEGLIKGFITNPANTLFPENLRSKIQDLLKDPAHENELNQLQSTILAAKRKFIAEKEQTSIMRQETKKRSELDLQNEFQNSLNQIKEKQHQERQKLHAQQETKERSRNQSTEQLNRSELTNMFEKMLQNLKQKEINNKTAKLYQKNIIEDEPRDRQTFENNEEEEYQQLLQQYKRETTQLRQRIARKERLSKTKPISPEQEAEQKAKALQETQERRKLFQSQLELTKTERSKMKENAYKNELAKAQKIDPDKFKDIPAAIIKAKNNIRQDIVEKYVDEYCKPFQEALDNPELPSDQRAYIFLQRIPKIALQNGEALKYYLNLNDMSFIQRHLILDVNNVTEDEQNMIFTRLAQKIKNYKKIYDKKIGEQYKTSGEKYKETIKQGKKLENASTR